jgi:hypothetical protein
MIKDTSLIILGGVFFITLCFSLGVFLESSNTIIRILKMQQSYQQRVISKCNASFHEALDIDDIAITKFINDRNKFDKTNETLSELYRFMVLNPKRYHSGCTQ